MPPADQVVAVVVTYHPAVEATAALLRALAPQVRATVVVDNGSAAEQVRGLAAACAEVGAELVRLSANTGIAHAQNQGIARARQLGADAVLLSDQDSLPAPDMVDRLVAGLRAAAAGGRVGAVGPVTLDERQPSATLLFADRRWGPRRAPRPADGELVEVTFLLASGCLIPLDVLEEVGGMNEAWFIDHIDLEWGLRARRAGYRLYGVGGAVLGHHLGDRTMRIPGRERDVHLHSPVRNYYMARNTLLLVRSGLLSPAWRAGYLFWITKYAVFYALVVPPRRRRLREVLRGAVDGVRGRTGVRAGGRYP
ncbi:glycosyltransferase family 2 protein [Georgenia sp. TF02-10]|uniref:glycosyltransferase family 2 protein n=1 Tax=Georgenia sp. TF02-10 TaxID=2917725 RepID=UPI001FA7CAB7|nr:glycosyltransferase family 2 protein [Georgenia sp. TF02-10]UNX55758.1 glycosyltransferase family 2 protein [Georgenia sp. TF02-10]